MIFQNAGDFCESLGKDMRFQFDRKYQIELILSGFKKENTCLSHAKLLRYFEVFQTKVN